MKRAVLLDLGNVVLGVDFRRVFSAWARDAGVPEQVFYDRWAVDQAYKDHETGNIDFETYAAALARRFDVTLPLAKWRGGWNDLWTEPFHSIIELLPDIARHYHLCAFTNTNDTHAICWRGQFADKLTSFADIYVSSEIGLRKPDEAAYQHVCECMSMKPADVIFLDDTLENINGAHSAGLDARHVASEVAVAETLRSLL